MMEPHMLIEILFIRVCYSLTCGFHIIIIAANLIFLNKNHAKNFGKSTQRSDMIEKKPMNP